MPSFHLATFKKQQELFSTAGAVIASGVRKCLPVSRHMMGVSSQDKIKTFTTCQLNQMTSRMVL